MATFPYQVKPGDTLTKIARQHGIATWQEIYQHPDNAAFRAKRPNPDRIFPGDTVNIPGRSGTSCILPVVGTTPGIQVRQVLADEKTLPAPFVQHVVNPVSLQNPNQQSQLTFKHVSGRIRAFRFEVIKGNARFWVGAAVPLGTSDFARVQVFFHPTPIQGHIVRAADRDYPEFEGGWPSIARYVSMQGQQLAAVPRNLPLLIPFMTMKALDGTAPHNVFADRPVETLMAILDATRIAMGDSGGAMIQLAAIGASSYSSGIDYLALFIKQVAPSRLLVEAFDFDGSWTHMRNRGMESAAGALYTRFGQNMPLGTPNRIPLPPPRWAAHDLPRREHTSSEVHGFIGFECFHSAMFMSRLRPANPTL